MLQVSVRMWLARADEEVYSIAGREEQVRGILYGAANAEFSLFQPGQAVIMNFSYTYFFREGHPG